MTSATEKLYGIDTWDDMSDMGEHHVLGELYRTRDAAENAAAELSYEDEFGYRYYAMVVEFKVVGE